MTYVHKVTSIATSAVDHLTVYEIKQQFTRFAGEDAMNHEWHLLAAELK